MMRRHIIEVIEKNKSQVLEQKTRDINIVINFVYLLKTYSSPSHRLENYIVEVLLKTAVEVILETIIEVIPEIAIDAEKKIRPQTHLILLHTINKTALIRAFDDYGEQRIRTCIRL